MPQSFLRCYARECGASRATDKLMCYRHWSMVPHELQERIVTLNRRRIAGLYAARTDWLAAINEARDLVTPPQPRQPA